MKSLSSPISKWFGASAGSRGSTVSCGKLVAGPSREFTEVITLPESCRLAKAPDPGEPAEDAPRDSGGAPSLAAVDFCPPPRPEMALSTLSGDEQGIILGQLR